MDSFESPQLFKIDSEPSPPDSLFDFGIFTTRHGEAVSTYLPLTPASPPRPDTPKPKIVTPIIPLENMETNTSINNLTTTTHYPPGDTPFIVEQNASWSGFSASNPTTSTPYPPEETFLTPERNLDWLEERFRFGGPISNFQPASLQ